MHVFAYTKPHIYAVFYTSLSMKNYGFLSFWCQNGATEDARCLHGLFLHECKKKRMPTVRQASAAQNCWIFNNRRFAVFINSVSLIDKEHMADVPRASHDWGPGLPPVRREGELKWAVLIDLTHRF